MTKILSLNARNRPTPDVFNTLSSDDMRRLVTQGRIRNARIHVSERIRARLRSFAVSAA